MFSTKPTHSSQGDVVVRSYTKGDHVEFIVSVSDGTGWRIHPATGVIVAIYTDPDLSFDATWTATYQGQIAARYPTEHCATGFDIQLHGSSVPWTCYDMPEYYHPRSDQSMQSLIDTRAEATVTCLYVPMRHVIRNVTDTCTVALTAMEGVLNRFFRRSPIGWVVLFHEPQLGTDATCPSEHAIPAALSELFQFDYENETPPTRGKRPSKATAAAAAATKTHALATIRTRRVIGQVVDFGVDFDGVLKLICRSVNMSSQSTLDYYMFNGPFSEVAYVYPNDILYKLPYDWIHDAYDEATLGPQTYFSVLKHIICDTLERFRIKTIKCSTAATTTTTTSSSSSQTDTAATVPTFYYGFTEDGMHFAKNGRMVLESAIPAASTVDPLDPTCEIRQHVYNYRWLNLRGATQYETTRFSVIKRGYIIYGRVAVRKETGQTTLEWCTPPPGMDLLRVYLATEGKSTIFRKLTQPEVFAKFKDHDGNPTLASKLFERIIDPTARNDAIDYVLRELVWSSRGIDL